MAMSNVALLASEVEKLRVENQRQKKKGHRSARM
jgi:uncharacterized small protein (DUF1192 family)